MNAIHRQMLLVTQKLRLGAGMVKGELHALAVATDHPTKQMRMPGKLVMCLIMVTKQRRCLQAGLEAKSGLESIQQIGNTLDEPM